MTFLLLAFLCPMVATLATVLAALFLAPYMARQCETPVDGPLPSWDEVMADLDAAEVDAEWHRMWAEAVVLPLATRPVCRARRMAPTLRRAGARRMARQVQYATTVPRCVRWGEWGLVPSAEIPYMGRGPPPPMGGGVGQPPRPTKNSDLVM